MDQQAAAVDVPQEARERTRAVAGRLAELPPVTVYEANYVKRPPKVNMSQPLGPGSGHDRPLRRQDRAVTRPPYPKHKSL